MTSFDWRAVGNVNPRELGKARHLAHNGAQWLARVACSYSEPATGETHTCLSWEDDGHALVTPEFFPGLVLELRLPELVLQFKEEGKRVTYQFEMDDRSPAEVEAWLLVELLHRGVDRDRLSKDLPYKFPGLMTGDAVKYSAIPDEGDLQELSHWYANAASVLGQVRDKHPPGETGPSPIRCWPHNFNMDVIFNRSGDKQDRSIRVGLAPGDGHYDEPYFYVTPLTYEASEDLPDIPDIGHWHTKDFIGAILTGSQIVENAMTGDDIAGFIGAVISAEQERPGA